MYDEKRLRRSECSYEGDDSVFLTQDGECRKKGDENYLFAAYIASFWESLILVTRYTHGVGARVGA